MLEKYTKTAAVFMMAIIFFSIFTVYNVKEVDAAQTTCCLKTTDNQYCVEDATNCASGQSLTGFCDAVPDCEKVTCVPNNGVCLSDYSKWQCESEGGTPYSQPKEDVPECQVGCCKDISACGIVQKNQCPGTFDSGITDSRTCDAQCSTSELGCCRYTNSCEFGKSGDCTSGTFYANQQCNQVDFCNAKYESHKYTACGDSDLISNGEQDVYWYDSNGNMEEKVGTASSSTFLGKIFQVDADNNRRNDRGECNYPDEKCYDSDEKGGKNAYCKSTACVIDCPECKPRNFLNGESICMDVLPGHYNNGARSTYLHEYILTCSDGEVLEDLELKRNEKICIEGVQTIDGVERKHATTINNNWQSCLDCGKGGGIFDTAGYIPVFGGLLLNGFGSWCSAGADNDGSVFSNVPGAFTNYDKCSDMGKIGDVEMCYYDHDFWAPLGSCNPVYPPAGSDKCGECGKGGDGTPNICTEQECNALGDCKFESSNLDFNSLATMGALALGAGVAMLGAARIYCPLSLMGEGACQGAVLGALGGIYSSWLFWGVYAVVVGSGALGSSDNSGDYRPAYQNVDGSYDLARYIATARAVQRYEESQSAQNSPFMSPPYIGPGVVNTEVALTTVTPEVATTGLSGTTTTTSAAAAGGFPWATVGIYTGVALVTYGISESFNAGSCSAESAYTDNSHCSQCGPGEGQFFCSKNRCDILGGANGNCRFVSYGEGTDDGICVPVDPTDTTVPVIESIKLRVRDINGTITREASANDNVLDVKPEMAWNSAHTVKINITTDERSSCKADFKAGTAFDSMGEDFNSDFALVHELEFNLTEPIKEGKVATLYIKCENRNGVKHNPTEDMNKLILRFGERPDVIGPTFKRIDPYANIFLPEDTSEIKITLTVYDNNGVQACKYSSENRTNYAEMEGTFTKGSRVNCPGSSSKDCDIFTNTFNLEGVGEQYDSTLEGYSENGTYHSYIFGCVDTMNNLEIIEHAFVVSPTFGMNLTEPFDGQEIYVRKPTVNITTEVDTLCSYKVDNDVNWTNFNDAFDTRKYNTKLKTELSSSPEGTQHTLVVRCRDKAGNEREETVSFYVISDVQTAYPVRIFTTGSYGSGQLHVLLNEKASCKYITDSSDFEYEDEGTLMRAVPPENEEQVTTWDNNVYYIRCKDEFDNIGGFTIYP